MRGSIRLRSTRIGRIRCCDAERREDVILIELAYWMIILALGVIGLLLLGLLIGLIVRGIRRGTHNG